VVRPAPSRLERAAERAALTELDDARLAFVRKRSNVVGRVEVLDLETGHGAYLLSLLLRKARSSAARRARSSEYA
jgi:hypothetical protein